jgi:hypothetical protein
MFYIFGGTVDGRQAQGDFWVFDSAREEWERIATQGREHPRAVFGAALVPMEDSLLLIGGSAPEGLDFLFWRFWIADGRWEPVRAPSLGPMPSPVAVAVAPTATIVLTGATETDLLCVDRDQTKRVKVSGIPPIAPEARKRVVEDEVETIGSSISAVAYREWVIVFGDNDDTKSYAVSLGETKHKWIALPASAKFGPVPAISRYAACAGDDCVWLHGGVMKYRAVGSALYKIQLIGQDRNPLFNERGRVDVARLALLPIREREARDTVKEEPWVLKNINTPYADLGAERVHLDDSVPGT